MNRVLTGLAMDGGAEVQTVQLALRLKRRGWDVSLGTLRRPKSIPAVLTESGISVLTAEVGGLAQRGAWQGERANG